MKRILTFVIAIAMTLSLTVVAYADSSIDVTVNISTDATPAPVYSIQLKWEGADFTYYIGVADGWKTQGTEGEYHAYLGHTGGTGWGASREDEMTSTVKVLNHSNAAIDVKADIVAAGDVTGVTATITDENYSTETKHLEAATTQMKWEDAPSTTYTCKVTGKPNAAGKVATITVTIA